jgi:putative ABC transport system permease protein
VVLLGGFALFALLLASLGIYAVISYGVNQRTQEIGIRMALGANRHQVMTMVLRQALQLSLLGVVIGLPLAWAAGRLAREELVQTSQHDPLAMAAAVVILLLLAVVATFLPARQAAAVNPVSALRAE